MLAPSQPKLNSPSSCVILLLTVIFFLGLYTQFLQISSNSSKPRSLSTTLQVQGLKACKAFTAPTKLDKPLIGTPPSIRNYVSWHKIARQCLDDIKCADKPEVLVWNCGVKNGCSGFGDRLRGIAGMFFLSVVTKRAFFIDWPYTSSDPFPITAAMIPSVIDWRPPRHVRNMLQKRRTDQGFLQVNWDKEKDEENNPLVSAGNPWMFRSSALSPLLSDISLLAVNFRPGWTFLSMLRRNEELIKNFPDLRHNVVDVMTMHKILLQTIFKPTAAIQERMDLIVPPDTPPFISVHARLGDDVGEGERDRFEKEREVSRERIAEELFSCVSKQTEETEGERVVFLASDSTPFKKTFIDEAGTHNFKVLTSGIRAMTMAHDRVHMSTKDEHDEKCEGFLNIFVDLFLLSRGHAIVAMRSGFSRAAFYLGGSSSMHHGYSPAEEFSCRDVSLT